LKRSVEQLPSADAGEGTPHPTPTQRTGEASYSRERTRQLYLTCSAGQQLAGGSEEPWRPRTVGRGSGGGAASGRPETGRRSGRCRRARRRRPAPFCQGGATPSSLVGSLAGSTPVSWLLRRSLAGFCLSVLCPLDEKMRFAPKLPPAGFHWFLRFLFCTLCLQVFISQTGYS
jgi:hypothetical protein